jgi:hypothetical protein
MDIDETIDAFRRAALDLDCKKIVLSQHKEGGERFEGQGYIRQELDGILIFKLYVTTYENAKPLGNVDAQLNVAAGKLYSDEMFYDLEAVGRDGTHWRAVRLLPAINWNMSDRSVLANGQMQSIVATLDLPQRHHYLRLHFFEEYEVPLRLMSKTEKLGREYMVRDRNEFDACGSKFEVQKRDGDTIIEVTSDAAFPKAFHLRIQEALQYVTGKPAVWRARLQSNGGTLVLELASRWRQSGRTRFDPPISPASADFVQHGWTLFACYLTYVLANTEDTHWNPVAYHLYNACEATANSVDAWAVGISVAAEAVAGLIELPNDVAKAERLALFQKRMCECLATQTDFPDLVPRMKGLIAGMSRKRLQDTMYALAERGHVENSYVRAWTYLRNRHVHPTLKDLRKPDPGDHQNLLNHIRRVEVLLRQLTFYLIKYKGPFTDYGSEKFPSKQYPLVGSDADNP